MAKRPTLLRIDNAAEDVPRRIQGSGRTPNGGTWGLVLLPHNQVGTLLLAAKDGSVRQWRQTDRSDCPQMPTDSVELDPAVAALHSLGRQRLGPRTPITLKGEWKGHMKCTEYGPVVTLRRTLNSYVELLIESTNGPRREWRWTLKRSKRWFTEGTERSGTSVALLGAIRAALASAEGVVGEACTVRDTRRRGAKDKDYKGRVGAVREAKVRGRAADATTIKARRKKKAATPKTTTAPKKAAAPKESPASKAPTKTNAGPKRSPEVAALRKATAKKLDTWRSRLDERSAKSWVRSALHHAGLPKAELVSSPGAAHGIVLVDIESFDKPVAPSDFAAKMGVVEQACPTGIRLSLHPRVESSATPKKTTPKPTPKKTTSKPTPKKTTSKPAKKKATTPKPKARTQSPRTRPKPAPKPKKQAPPELSTAEKNSRISAAFKEATQAQMSMFFGSP